MSESFTVILAFVTGVLLGTFFYGGLWWTIQKGVSSRQPAHGAHDHRSGRILFRLARQLARIAGLPRWICDRTRPCDVVYANSY